MDFRLHAWYPGYGHKLMSEKRNWTEDEEILALCLYYELPTAKHDKNTPQVKELASLLGRSVGAVVFKLGNLKALDDSTEGIGFVHGAKLDKLVFDKFIGKPAELFERRDEILALKHSENIATPTAGYNLPDSELDKLAHELEFSQDDKMRLQKWRERQWAFRLSLMKGYNEHCCLSGIRNPDFLIASHIVPWSVDKENRLNPRNGLLLNVFLDKAFDKGYMSIDSRDYTVMVSNRIADPKIESQLSLYKGQRIILPRNPDRWPDSHFLEYHNDVVFKAL